MENYEYWFDAEGNPHEISKMNTQYIKNCLKQLHNMLNSWRGIAPEELSMEELKDKDEVGMKAWFVFNGIKYIHAFTEEFDRRN